MVSLAVNQETTAISNLRVTSWIWTSVTLLHNPHPPKEQRPHPALTPGACRSTNSNNSNHNPHRWTPGAARGQRQQLSYPPMVLRPHQRPRVSRGRLLLSMTPGPQSKNSPGLHLCLTLVALHRWPRLVRL